MSETAEYLIKKKALEESIQWYTKTINEVDAQQAVRRSIHLNLQQDLYELEFNYYKGNK